VNEQTERACVAYASAASKSSPMVASIARTAPRNRALSRTIAAGSKPTETSRGSTPGGKSEGNKPTKARARSIRGAALTVRTTPATMSSRITRATSSLGG
jgi:hypothetical protein